MFLVHSILLLEKNDNTWCYIIVLYVIALESGGRVHVAHPGLMIIIMFT